MGSGISKAIDKAKRPSTSGDAKERRVVDWSTEECGVTLEYLDNLIWRHRKNLEEKQRTTHERVRVDYTMQDLLDDHIRPQSTTLQCRYVNVINPDVVRPPGIFVCYRRDMKAEDFIGALKRYFHWEEDREAAEKATVWLDLLALSQHTPWAAADDLGPVIESLRATSHTVVVMEESAEVLRRMWCLWEIWKSFQIGGSSKVRIAWGQEEQPAQGLGKERLQLIDVATARSHRSADEDKLKDDMIAGSANYLDAGEEAEDLTEKLRLDMWEVGVGGKEHLERVRAGLVTEAKGLWDEVDEHVRVAELAEAHEKAERAVELTIEARRGESLETAAALDRLSDVVQARGDSDQARDLRLRAIGVREKLHGERSMEVAGSFNTLGEMLRVSGLYDDSEEAFQRSLDICEEICGPDHPTVVVVLNHLVNLLKTQGKLVEATGVFERIVRTNKIHYGAGSPEAAVDLSTLSALLQAQGHLPEALPFLEESVAIQERVSRQASPELAAALGDLAALKYELEHYDEAQGLLQQSLEMLVSMLGEDHQQSRIVRSFLQREWPARTYLDAYRHYIDSRTDLAGVSLLPPPKKVKKRRRPLPPKPYVPPVVDLAPAKPALAPEEAQAAGGEAVKEEGGEGAVAKEEGKEEGKEEEGAAAQAPGTPPQGDEGEGAAAPVAEEATEATKEEGRAGEGAAKEEGGAREEGEHGGEGETVAA